MSINPCYVYDFTLPAEVAEVSVVRQVLSDHCKKYCFQLEEGTSGYQHYQGRFSLKEKQRLLTIKEKLWEEIHLSPTSKGNVGNYFYVTKEDSRCSGLPEDVGPWKDTDHIVKLTWDLLHIVNLYDWQQYIYDNCLNDQDLRGINCLIDRLGKLGKSSLVKLMGILGIAKELPFCKDFKDLMRMVMDMPIQKAYIIDMPRAINKKDLAELYSAIEKIKGGYAFDDRYHFKDKYFGNPIIWVFTNKFPDLELLSRDRWNLFAVDRSDGGICKIENEEDLANVESFRCTNCDATENLQFNNPPEYMEEDYNPLEENYDDPNHDCNNPANYSEHPFDFHDHLTPEDWREVEDEIHNEWSSVVENLQNVNISHEFSAGQPVNVLPPGRLVRK